MKIRFEPDVPPPANDALTASLIDPEAYDASEQKFAASLEQTSPGRPPRFVVDETSADATPETEPDASAPSAEARTAAPAARIEDTFPESPDPDAWRREVAARLSHYRARRRPREPRYPSLQLKFETEQASTAPGITPEPLPAAPVPERRQAADYVQSATAPRITFAEPGDYPRMVSGTVPAATTEATAKVIEFANYMPAPRSLDELAEPVLDRPRIIEAPELVPPPPALGGILIEPAEEPANERRPGFEIPLRAAPMARRMAAAAIDATLVMSAFAAFAYICLRMTTEVPPLGKMAGTAVLLIAGLWCAYQYLLLVYSGTTPGLKLARLELHRFDGNAVPLRVRRWRVLASVLSGVSLGLGYAWCLLDEDQLCWHDRITRTYMAPRK